MMFGTLVEACKASTSMRANLDEYPCKLCTQAYTRLGVYAQACASTCVDSDLCAGTTCVDNMCGVHAAAAGHGASADVPGDDCARRGAGGWHPGRSVDRGGGACRARAATCPRRVGTRICARMPLLGLDSWETQNCARAPPHALGAVGRKFARACRCLALARGVVRVRALAASPLVHGDELAVLLRCFAVLGERALCCCTALLCWGTRSLCRCALLCRVGGMHALLLCRVGDTRALLHCQTVGDIALHVAGSPAGVVLHLLALPAWLAWPPPFPGFPLLLVAPPDSSFPTRPYQNPHPGAAHSFVRDHRLQATHQALRGGRALCQVEQGCQPLVRPGGPAGRVLRPEASELSGVSELPPSSSHPAAPSDAG
eukprot:364989-Chlamydomonas_euryale.AAC.3